MCAAKRRGFTLLEIMIASGISAAIATVMVAFLITSLQAQARMAVRVDIQGQAMMACNRVARDLQGSVLAGVSLRKSAGTEPEVLAIHPLLGISTGDPPSQLFSRQVVIYVWKPGQGRIVRLLWPPDPGHPPTGAVPTVFKPFRIGQDELLTLGNSSGNPTSQSFGGDVTAFNVTTAAAPPQISPPITLTLSLAKNVKGRIYNYTLTRKLSLRNSD